MSLGTGIEPRTAGHIELRVDAGMRTDVVAAADARGMTLSDWLRDSIISSRQRQGIRRPARRFNEVAS